MLSSPPRAGFFYDQDAGYPHRAKRPSRCTLPDCARRRQIPRRGRAIAAGGNPELLERAGLDAVRLCADLPPDLVLMDPAPADAEPAA